jgi:hypothetical protein
VKLKNPSIRETTQARLFFAPDKFPLIKAKMSMAPEAAYAS